MTSPSDRSSRRRKIHVKTPGGVNKIVVKRRKPNKAKCGTCGSQLHGVPSALPAMQKKMSKSSKRPERPYGGNLCSKCTRLKITLEAGIEQSS